MFIFSIVQTFDSADYFVYSHLVRIIEVRLYPFYTLGSDYGAKASRAKQVTETDNSN